MKLGIIGSGALASLFAARLAPLTAVTMLGHWPAQAQAVRDHGLTLHDSSGVHSNLRVAFVTDAADLPLLDVALVLVKSYQTERAAHEISVALQKEGVAITLQNGLLNAEILAAVLGGQRVVQGVTAQGATMLRAGHVRHAGHGPTVMGITMQPSLLAETADLFREAGLETSLAVRIAPYVWGKLAVNAAINPVTALLRVRNGYLVTHEAAGALMRATAEEVAAVAEVQGIELPYSSAAARAAEVAQATAENISSMLQDVQRRAPTEIEAINGAVLARGQVTGTAVPLNAELRSLLRELERGGSPGPSRLRMVRAALQEREETNDDRYRID